ncbi:MAG: sugar phosphate isomerase/epimerase family protein [bacterium]
MQIGLTISNFDGKRPGELVALVRKFGVRFVEFNPTVFGDLASVMRQINDDMSAGFHLPLLAEHGFDLTQREHKDKIDDLIYFINQHRHELNLLYCVAHPPEIGADGASNEEELEFLIENLKRLDVPVILENVETWSENDFDSLIEVIRNALKKQFIGQCFDPAHAFLRGEDIFARFSAIAPHVRCIHLSDCARGHDAHLPLGQGELPVEKFLQHVANFSYDGIINLEVIPGSLREVGAVVKSYLQVLRVFKKGEYLATKTKLLLGGARTLSFAH